MNENLLELKAVAKVYSAQGRVVRAVDGVSLALAKGDFVSVQGASGCGKTTLLLMAGGLLCPDSGTVKVNGQDPYLLKGEERARFRADHVGFVFQQFHLVPYLTVLDNVMAPSLGKPASDAADRAGELLERFGLVDRMHHVPAQLSTGERQRTALARALLNRPCLLLADEPTGNLDSENAEGVLEHLAGFARQGGAVLLVTHDERAASWAGRRIRMEAGREIG